MTGHEIARKMLRDSELFGIDIFRDKSFYGDPFLGKYDMKQRLIILNDFIYDGESAKAIAVAIHECGHAIQHKIFYWPLMIDIITMKFFGFRWFASKIESDASKRGLKWFESKVKCSTIFIDEVRLYLVSQLNLVIEPII